MTLAAASVHAQAVRGLGDDALTPPRGTFRIQVSNSIADFSQRYGRNTAGRSEGALEPVGVDFSLDTIGVAQFPGLSSAQTALRSLTGNNAFTLSLGRSVLTSTVRVQTAPILLEAGLSNRLSVGVMVPLVNTRNVASFNVNSAANKGTVGFNPARADASTADVAAATNATLVSQLTAARDQLAARLAQCTANPGSNAQCPAILTSAPAINASATAFAQGVTQVYGTTASRASAAAYVPLTASAADSAIRTRVTTLRSQFEQFGVTAISATTTGPAGAVAITPTGLQRVIADSASGLAAEPLNTITRQGLGDIEVSLKLRLFDTFGFRSDTMRFLPRGMNIRQSFGGAMRFGTGTIDQP
ncbi:MAG TPA: hypothetical protein VE861_13765, partial [Gemmatimonadaceae bacterium]|nr:hypothetical protein [Gemmatimonadaceae bacterium]